MRGYNILREHSGKNKECPEGNALQNDIIFSLKFLYFFKCGALPSDLFHVRLLALPEGLLFLFRSCLPVSVGVLEIA